jgi:hypothetical protein
LHMRIVPRILFVPRVTGQDNFHLSRIWRQRPAIVTPHMACMHACMQIADSSASGHDRVVYDYVQYRDGDVHCRLLVGRAELHQPRNLGEVALGERAVLSLALVPSVCLGSTPSKKRSTHSLSRPVSATACLSCLSCTR